MARGKVPGDDREVVGHSAVRDGDAGHGGYAERAADARDHGHRHAGLTAGQHLFEPSPEDEVVATLEPRDASAGERLVDDDAVDLLLGGRAASRKLGHVEDLGVRGQLGEQLSGREPVGDDDVGIHQRLASGHGDELGVTRPTPDEDDPGCPRPMMARGDGALPEPGDDLVAHSRGPARVAVGG